MDAEEIGRLIAELENRVERLRALYEQYFMGIERLEPLTVRKDIDRRLWALRREQIRNTGLRFKLETTIQRYNTYQQYWQRIVREIEQGTYQRDLGRAAQRFGDNVVTAFAKRRQKMFEKAVTKKAERDARRTGPIASETAPAEADDGPPSSNQTFDVTFEDEGAAPSTRSPEVPALPPIEPLELDIGIPAAPRPAPAPAAPRAPLPAAARPPPAAPTPASPVNARPAILAVSPVKPGTPLAAAGKPIAPAVAPAKAVAPPAPAARPAAPPVPAAKPIALGAPGAKPAAPPAPAAPFARPAAPAAPFARPGAPVAPGAKPAAPTALGAKPAALAAPAVKPAAPVVPAPQAVAHRPAAPSRPDVPPQPGIGEESSLSPIRMRQIYGAFVEAKRRANESTASVTYEKIASNLESVAKELRAKHKARSVDFEVVMKNGKPVLKPVVKG